MIKLKQVRKVWDRGGHNAFTDICWFKNHFWLVFREASHHISDDGIVVVLKSKDGIHWELSTELKLSGSDLRDPKLVVMPDQRLLMTVAGVKRAMDGAPLQSYLYFSDDGVNWAEPKPVGLLNHWLWRTRFIGGLGYGVSYNSSLEVTTLYKLNDQYDFDKLCDPLFSLQEQGLGYPNEHDLFPLADNKMGCLLRRDADTATAQLGVANAPFVDWAWQDLGVKIGGPVVLPLNNGSLLTVVRLYEPARTSVCELDEKTSSLKELLPLPSGGDTSYAGLVEHNGRIWCSYYSSHEGKAAIYVAELDAGL